MNINTDFSAIEKKSQRNERIRKIITYVLLTFWAVIVLFPFYWMILTSVKSYSAYNSEYVPQLCWLPLPSQGSSSRARTSCSHCSCP